MESFLFRTIDTRKVFVLGLLLIILYAIACNIHWQVSLFTTPSISLPDDCTVAFIPCSRWVLNLTFIAFSISLNSISALRTIQALHFHIKFWFNSVQFLMCPFCSNYCWCGTISWRLQWNWWPHRIRGHWCRTIIWNSIRTNALIEHSLMVLHNPIESVQIAE